MSQILAQWLNKEVFLSKKVPPSELDYFFSNAYYYGELFQKLQLEFANNLTDSKSVEAVVRNYTIIEKFLRENLEIILSANEAKDLALAKKGCAAALLHQIKIAAIRKKSLNRKLFHKEDLEGLGLPILPFKFEDPSKKLYNEEQKKIFAELLTAKLTSDKHLTNIFSTLVSLSMAVPKIEKKQENINLLNNLDVNNKLNPVVADVSLQLKKFENAVNPNAFAATSTDDIVENLVDKQRADANSIKQFLAIKAPMDSVQHMKLLKIKAPSILGTEEVQKQLDNIRIKKLEEANTRKSNESKRRKAAILERKRLEQQEIVSIEESVLETIVNISKQERRLAADLFKIRREKDVERENRIVIANKFNALRQTEFEEAIAQRHLLYVQMKEENKERDAKILTEHANYLSKKRVEHHKLTLQYCETLMENLLGFVFKVSEYNNENFMRPVPRNIYRNWMNELFKYELVKKEINSTGIVEDKIDTIVERTENSQSSLTTHAHEYENLEIIDEEEFREYMNGEGVWSFDKDRAEKIKELLTPIYSMIDTIFDVISIPEQEPEQIKSFPLRLSIIGKPYSGKFSIAKEISRLYGLPIISADELVQSALCEAVESQELASPSKVQLNQKRNGHTAKLATKSVGGTDSQCPTDQYVTQLVTDAIQKLTEGDVDGQKNFPGWILLNFPKNRVQAQLLEKELSGYEDPKPAKGHLKRGTVQASNKEKLAPPTTLVNRKKSVATSDHKLEKPVATSGIDIVILLDAEVEKLTTRLQNTKHSPEYTQLTELNTTMSLSTLPEKQLVEDLDRLHEQIINFEEQEDVLRDWFSKFNNLQTVETNSSVEVAVGKINEIIKEFAIRKEKDDKSEEILTQILDTNEEGLMESSPTRDINSPNTSFVDEEKRTKLSSATKSSRVLTEGRLRRISSQFRDKKNSEHNTSSIESSRFLALDSPQTSPTKSLVVETFKKALSINIAETLADRWNFIESNYAISLKNFFKVLIVEKEEIKKILNLKNLILKNYFLASELNKFEIIKIFEIDYDAIDDHLRIDPDVKCELVQRLNDLMENLWELSDKRLDESEREIRSSLEEKWMETNINKVTKVYLSAMQAEVDRYTLTRQLVEDYFNETTNSTATSLNIISVLDQNSTVASDFTQLLLKKLDTFNQDHKFNHPITSLSSNNSSDGAAHYIEMMFMDKNVKTEQMVDVSRFKGSAMPSESDIDSTEKTENVGTLLDKSVEDIFSKLNNVSNVGSNTNIEIVLVNEPQPTSNYEADDQKKLLKTILENELTLLKWNLERIKEIGNRHITQLKNEGIEFFINLFGLNNYRFSQEMEFIKEVSTLIKNTLDSESLLNLKLSREIIEYDKKFEIKIFNFFENQVKEPKSEPLTSAPFLFTLLQLQNLYKLFEENSSGGEICSKEQFIDTFQNTSRLFDDKIFPKILSNSSSHQLGKMFDVYANNGNILNWKKMLLFDCKMAHPLDEQYLKNVKTELKVLESDNYGKVTLKSFMELLVSSLEERIGTTVAIDENIASSTSIYDFVTACKNGINLINNANQEFSEMYENNCEVQLDWHKITEEPLKHEIFVNLNVEMFEKFFDVVLLLEKEIFDVEKVSKIELAEKLNENEITQNSV